MNKTKTHEQQRFNIEHCIDWINHIQPRNVCLYFLPKFYQYANQIVKRLQDLPDIRFFITVTCTTGPETLPFRLQDANSQIDAAIYFGCDCLCPERYSKTLPMLFVSFIPSDDELDYIIGCIDQEFRDSSNINVLLMSDLTHSSFLTPLANKIQKCDLFNNKIEITKFVKPLQENWYLEPNVSNLFDETDAFSIVQYPYRFKNNFNYYEVVVFIGECQDLEMIISCRKMLMIDPMKENLRTLDGAKEFRKRISLIEKFKIVSNKSIGIVYKDFQSSISSSLKNAKYLSKRAKKLPYFISLNQSDFESRLGNFTQLTGFVFINVCRCEYQMATELARYLYPVIFWKEFQIACGLNLIYGGIEWNENCDITYDEDCENESESNESNLIIIERNQQQKLCSNDSWYGLIVDAGSTEIESVKQGRSGIASNYDNEQELF
ncbi:uncharacterized protein LOC113799414 [Dermatophagoides pteronyssinus]|uniref:uncharacterized protein LOC113799414 n=1 Tax=Dermatophagoides pteronyssinus TaxID=6956 RepID=UPI003F662FBD